MFLLVWWNGQLEWIHIISIMEQYNFETVFRTVNEKSPLLSDEQGERFQQDMRDMEEGTKEDEIAT